MEKRQGKWDARRVFDALAKIGYEPHKAIMDIVDNSVSAHAENVNIVFNFDAPEDKRKKTIINRITITDDGDGMDEGCLENALALGSSTQYYCESTLSKFGLGLKSASSSLGRKLTILTRVREGEYLKAIIDQDNFKDGEYIIEFGAMDTLDKKRFDDQTKASHGTVIEISALKQDSLPSLYKIRKELLVHLPVVYFYSLSGRSEGFPKLSIFLDGEEIKYKDPLFEAEIENDASLEERNWNGTSVRWITKDKDLQLGNGVYARLKIVQLPHPPAVEFVTKTSRATTRDKYLIGKENYGIFIYRNSRLISWADSLEGIIPTNDNDLFSFRGILNITNEADDLLNIDVSKSHVHLSELAHQNLVSEIDPAKQKSRIAWKTANDVITNLSNNGAAKETEEIIDAFEEEEVETQRANISVSSQEDKKTIEEKIKKSAKINPLTPAEEKKVKEERKRIVYVPFLENNALWEKAHDPDIGIIVRINQAHKLVKVIQESMSNNAQAVKLFNIIIYCLARSEHNLLYSRHLQYDDITNVLNEFRDEFGSISLKILKEAEKVDSEYFISQY